MNGDAGSVAPDGVGICLTELRAARDDTPSKLLLIRVDAPETKSNFSKKSNADFRREFDELWMGWEKMGASASSAEQLVAVSVDAVRRAVVRHAELSLGQWRRERSLLGRSLIWASLPMSERAEVLRAELIARLTDAGIEHVGTGSATLALDSRRSPALLLTISAAPDAFGVPDARQYVGYPFRAERATLKSAASLGATPCIGPLHVVGTFKGVTESQIRAHLGNADVAILRLPFGFLAQDRVSCVQVAYLTHLSDPGTIGRKVTHLSAALQNDELRPQIMMLAAARMKMVV